MDCFLKSRFRFVSKLMERVAVLIIFFLLIVPSTVVQAQGFYESRAKGKAYARIVKDFHAIKKDNEAFGIATLQSLDGGQPINPRDVGFDNDSLFGGYSLDYVANFWVSDNSNSNFSVSLPNSPIALSNKAEDKQLLVKNWQSDFFNAKAAEISADGFKKVYIRATVDVEPYQASPDGLYTGFYIVTFDFN